MSLSQHGLVVYKPCSVELPQSHLIKREIPYPHPVEHINRHKEDVKTIFYDIFFSPLSHKFFCLGPTLYNLKQELFPLTITINGQKIKFLYYEIERLFFLEGEPYKGEFSNKLAITFAFRTFTKKVCIDADHNICSPNSSRLTISTLQKDNAVQWINDWIIWHRNLHGVERVVLYDNDSSNLKHLTETLSRIKNIQIILVKWFFPHGIRPYKSAQHGSLNHCRLKFPVQDGYCINLDIDEYLVKPSRKESLSNYLDQRLKYPSPGAVIFRSNIVPNTVMLKQGFLPRVWDFKFKFLKSAKICQISESNQYFKYIYKFENVGYNSPHKPRSHKNRIFCRRFNLVQKLKFHSARTIWNVKNQFHRTRAKKPRIDSIIVPESELYNFHFLGLTTGWQGNLRHKSYCEVDYSVHENAPEIEKWARLARLP